MGEETKKILEMLHQGKITVEEAENLLAAISSENPSREGSTKNAGARKYLRVQVESEKEGTRVNVRIPLKLIRAGLKLAAFLPNGAQSQVNHALQQKGIDLSKLTPADLEELVANIDDLSVDVEGNADVEGKQKVRIYSE
jgi:hypothetical protein